MFEFQSYFETSTVTGHRIQLVWWKQNPLLLSAHAGIFGWTLRKSGFVKIWIETSVRDIVIIWDFIEDVKTIIIATLHLSSLLGTRTSKRKFPKQKPACWHEEEQLGNHGD